MGGKGKLLWIINKMAPDHYSRFIDAFGGSGTVTMSRPIQNGCMEVYNDFNGNLTNLFCCVKNRPMALLSELGFLPLNTRDDFNVLYKFLGRDEITDDYLQEEMELTEVLLKPPDAEAIRNLLLDRAPRGNVRRAADYFKLVRYSFSGSAKSFGGKPCDIRRFFHLIWECSRRLANVEYTISGLSVELSNNAFGSGQSKGYTAAVEICLEVPVRFLGNLLPAAEMTLHTEAKYVPVF